MSYRVIQRFVDLQDNNHRYEVGDKFPRLNANVSKKRIQELSSAENRRKIPLIEEIREEKSVIADDSFDKDNELPDNDFTSVNSETEIKSKKKSKGKKKEA